MTDQPQQAPFTIAELGARFGAQLGQVYADIIILEKQLSAQALNIQELTANESRLVDHIQAIEAQLSELKAAKVAEETVQIEDEAKPIIQQGHTDPTAAGRNGGLDKR